MEFALIVPTLNAQLNFGEFLPAIMSQSARPKRLIVIDSESDDMTVQLAAQVGAEVFSISRSDFNHGRTRMLGVRQVSCDCEVVVFLTQDAILADPSALAALLDPFNDPSVDVVYGRQLPRHDATPIEAFARNFNYPSISENKSRADIPRLGFKACFCSNSFAAYRISRLLAVGGFPDDVIFGEDAIAVARILLSGGVVRYEARACTYHSHAYSVVEEAKRYFDIGVMHERSNWIISEFGTATSAGMSFIKAEILWLIHNNPLYIPEMLLRTIAKYISYKLGRSERVLPRSLKRRISMHRSYWR